MNKTIKQRMLILLTLLFGAMSAASAADRFYIDAANIEPGETRQLAFMLDNSQDFYGFQADITLPEGLEFVQTNGKADIKLSSRAGASYSTVSNLLADGSLRVGAFSTTHTAFSGNSGALMYANVHASDDFAGGTLAMRDILFVNSSDNDVKLPDFTIELGTNHNDSFYIPDFKIAVGETKTISVMLDNETPFTAFQTDVYLPEGLYIVDNSFELTSRASSGHSVSARSFADGRTRIICMSLSNSIFTGNSGALLNLDVTANKDIAETAAIEMKNQIFSMANAREYVIPNSQTVVTTERALVEEIVLNPSSVGLTVGDTRIVSASVIPSFASTKDVEWKSESTDIATVSESGMITAVAPGTTRITANAVDGSGVTAACEVTVSGIPVANIMLNRSSATLKATQTVSLTATIEPAGATDKSLTWASSDTDVATVDADGTVTALAVGNAVITATSVSNPEISVDCNITVVPTPVSSIVFNQTTVSLQAGATFAFAVTVEPETATVKDIVWTSENTSIASVDENGRVTAHTLGTTTIKATAADGSGVSASATVNVIPTPAESIQIQLPASTEFKAGETIRLTASVLPENASDKSVVWSCSDSNIATVSTTGEVTAVRVGEVVVKATNSAGISDEITLTVVPTLAESIRVLPETMTLKVNATGTLTVDLLPTTTTDKSVAYESSDPAVASVDESGTVKGLSVGTADISVTTKDGSDISAVCKVEVTPILVESVAIQYEGPASLQVGQT
ncbi:MAG: Ig-like domain-containing protein, partial [Muribaculaceae bacterium]|nr:Ig-like domain-containing protein [Muribaculaceae bacterium]